MGHFKIKATNVPDWARNSWVLRAGCRDYVRNSSSSMTSYIWRSAQGTYATDGHRLHLDESAVHDGLEGVSLRWLLHGDKVIPPELATNGAATLASVLASLPTPTTRGTLATSAVTTAIASMREEANRRNAEADAAAPPTAGRLKKTHRTRYKFAVKIGQTYFNASYIADACHGVDSIAWKLGAEAYDPIVIEAPNRLAIMMPLRMDGSEANYLVRDLGEASDPAPTPTTRRRKKVPASRKVAAAVSAAADAAMMAPTPTPEPISYRLCDRHGGGDICTAADIHAVMDAVRAAWTDGEPRWAMGPDGSYLAGLGSNGLWKTREGLLRDLEDKPAPEMSGPFRVHIGPTRSEWRTFGAANAYAMTRARVIGTGHATVVTSAGTIAARYVARDHRVTGDSAAVGEVFS